MEAENNYSQKINLHYLMKALGSVRQALVDYISRQENKSAAEISPSTASLTSNIDMSRGSSSLGHLCSTFGLSNFERDVLLLCAGMELDRSWSNLCARAQRNGDLNYPTFGLAVTALDEPDWDSLHPGASLRNRGLIKFGVSNTVMNAPLQIDEQIFHYLLGNYYLNEPLMGIVKSLETNDIPILVNSHQKLVEQIVTTWKQASERLLYLSLHQKKLSPKLFFPNRGLEITENGIRRLDFSPHEVQNQNNLPIIQLCGHEFDSKQAIAQAVCVQLKLKLYFLPAHNLPSQPDELDELLQMWERESLLSKSALILDCDDIHTGDFKQLNIIKSFIESIKSPLIVSSSERISAKLRSILTFDVYKPSSQEQRKIWENVLGTRTTETDVVIDDLISHFNLTAPEINSAYIKALTKDKLETDKLETDKLETDKLETDKLEINKLATDKPDTPLYPSPSVLWDSCRTQAQPKLDELGQRIHLKATWEDLVLNETQIQTLQSIAAHVQQRIQVYQKWGFAGKGGRGLGISALFSGLSGTGKTMSAEVLANELNLDLYRIDLSTTVSKYIGETEKNLRRIFDAAEGAGAILLFDEADALFGKRSDVKDARDRYANIEVSYLLQRMEEYQGLAILTTNLKDSIDTAFLRRIRFIVKYSFPDTKQRQEIWRRVFPKDTPTEELNFAKLARLNVAGGNIRNIALNAAFIAAHRGEPVRMNHIKLATQSEYMKLERTLTDSEIKGWV